MRLLLALLVLPGCLCSPRLVPVLPCGTECYTAASGTPGQGPCLAGSWHCSPDEPPVCLGEVGPAEETCDGVDNDCDGRIDEPLWRYCESACGRGTETCYQGTWTTCTAPAPQVETCDGIDNDCDGQTDEPSELPIEYCYTGDSEGLREGECRPGAVRCQRGLKVCANEVLPVPEVCDGLDNDCDGETDEGLVSSQVDFVFVVDNSGSMTTTIDAVKTASSTFAGSYANHPEVRWALFGAPDNDPAHDSLVSLISYLTDVGTFNNLMQLQAASGGGREPSTDALHMLADTANPLKVNWAPDAERYVILFTDEDPQSYVFPPYSSWDVTAAMLFAGSRFHAYVFTSPYYASSFQALGPSRQLQVLQLSDDPAVLGRALSALVQHATCKP